MQLRSSPSTELSDFGQLAPSGNERECKHTLKNTCQGNEVITNVISAFGIDSFDADIQIPETQLRALLLFPTPPLERPGELAGWLPSTWAYNFKDQAHSILHRLAKRNTRAT